MNESLNNHMEEIQEDDESKSLSGDSLVSDFEEGQDSVNDESDFSSQ